MDMKLELIVIPVTDVDRAKAFYVDQLGFKLEVDHQPNEHFRVVQATPVGSGCSIAFGKGIGEMAPGTMQGMHLVVPDIEAALAELRGKDVAVDGPFHFTETGQTPGLAPGSCRLRDVRCVLRPRRQRLGVAGDPVARARDGDSKS